MIPKTNKDNQTVIEPRYINEKIPAHVAGGRLNKSVAPHPFDQIREQQRRVLPSFRPTDERLAPVFRATLRSPRPVPPHVGQIIANP
jgi:hypothetical protein